MSYVRRKILGKSITDISKIYNVDRIDLSKVWNLTPKETITITGKGYIVGGHYWTGAVYDFYQYVDEIYEESWIVKTDYPDPGRSFGATFAINEKGYFYGGWDATNVVTDLDEYNGNTVSWAAKTSNSPGKSAPTGFTIYDVGYIVGGYSSDAEYVKTCDQYSPDTWTSKTDMPDPARSAVGASVLNNKGYVYGGAVAGGRIQDTDEYNPDIWTSKSNMPSPERSHFGFAAIDNKAYAYLGIDGSSNALVDTDEYNPDTWVSKANCTGESRYGVSPIAESGKAFAFSGYGFTDGYIRDSDKYDPVTNGWTNLTYAPYLRYGGRGFNLNLTSVSDAELRGYVFGGKYGSNKADMFKECAAYTPSDDSWRMAGMRSASAPDNGIMEAATFSSDNQSKAYIAGGYLGSWSNFPTYRTVACEEVYLDTWSVKSNMPSGRGNGVGCFKISSGGHVVNGKGSGGAPNNDNYRYIISTDTWDTKTDHPTNDYRSRGTAISGKGYILSYGPAFREYDLSSDGWTQKTSPNSDAISGAFFTISNKGYLCGGEWNGYRNYTQEYTPDTWVSKTNMPVSATWMASNVINNKGYTYGGKSSGETYMNDTYEYDPSQDGWTSKADNIRGGSYSANATTVNY